MFFRLFFFHSDGEKLDILVVQVVLFDTFNRSISEYSSSETLKKHFLSFNFELCFFLSGDDVRRVDINHNKQQLIMTKLNLFNNFFSGQNEELFFFSRLNDFCF